MRFPALSLIGLTLAACIHPSSTPVRLEPRPAVGAAAAARPAPARATPPCRRVVYIEVRKSERLLRARCAQGGALEMVVALGREPDGPKRAAADLRTPEGVYRVSGEVRGSRFHGFLPIDYPSAIDAEEAFREGRIEARDRDRILEAHRARRTPPSDTPLGGAIGFHGEGERWAGASEGLDWTLGCIAVSDANIDRLGALVEPGVIVWIRP